MRTLYLDCGMGAAGDMLMAALLELVDDKAAFLEKMNGLGLPGVAVSAVPAVKCGITGTHVAVTVHGEEEVSCDVSPEGHIHHHDHSHEHGHEHSHEHEHGHEHEHHHHDHDHGHHHHTGMGEIRHLLGHLELPEAVRADAEAVYGLIAEAESHAHARRWRRSTSTRWAAWTRWPTWRGSACWYTCWVWSVSWPLRCM